MITFVVVLCGVAGGDWIGTAPFPPDELDENDDKSNPKYELCKFLSLIFGLIVSLLLFLGDYY